MKTITFLVANLILIGTTANATTVNTKVMDDKRTHFNENEPISFVERGIEFFVFLNGDFDFNTRPEDHQGAYLYKAADRNTTQSDARRMVNYGVRIEHDSYGRVRRIGNTFINYDNRDRVNRIGSVYMIYNRMGLTQIGGMQLVYNRRGDLVDTIGCVKGYANYGYAYNHNDRDEHDSHTQQTNYYYKEVGTRDRD
jgi:hypothetical protein